MAPLPTKAARLVCALIASTALVSPALADAPRYGHRAPIKQIDRGYHAHNAGVLRINGERFRIDDFRSKRQIVRAFRDAGYRARIQDGKVVASFSWCDRPNVSWRTGTLDARIRYFHGRVVVKLIEPCPPRIRPVPACDIRPLPPRRPVHHGWRWNRSW
ncbi:MAG: hypothetical protein RIB60_08655 [Phycisphaerales bacterium]